MHPALPGPAGTPASQTQHCYPESGERLLHGAAFLHHQPLRRQGIEILIFTPGSPSGPLPGNGSGTQNPLPYKNLHTWNQEKGIHSTGELGRDTHKYCTCNLGTGRTRGFPIPQQRVQLQEGNK